MGINSMHARPVFNGGGYAITNLQQPLFGTVGEGWTLKSVNLVGAELACSDAGATVGIICSELYGDLFECIVSDSSVSNTGGAAGLVGSAYPGSEIRRCYANCAVTGAKASGLTGLSAGTIQDCYVAGTVEGTQQAAGFTLLYYETTMPKTCYSVAEIRCSTASVYGFAPMQSVGKKPIALEDCYYLFRSGINPAKDAAQKRQYQQMTGSGFLVELGSQWEWATQETSHPISGELWTSAYPFPKLKNLDHFGDWPLEGK